MGEVLGEILVEIVGGVLELFIDFATDSKSPKTLRGICLTLVTAVMLGFGGFCAYFAVTEVTNTASKVMLVLVALLMLAGCIGFWRKVLRKRKKRESFFSPPDNKL